ncbi:hypothetical protein GEU84_005605 [Fertoebacter nigrum]|uniref:Uncharacterized protein n=1 Tax=Fertoeibacter niger TaxID=2656921 RepID=A0A8X8KME9_9RHOB|nr:hypothetical protein [Fertoeibacter niger]NUB43850.1 hypothetical protein [Fertoeibacter niger]
MNDALVSMFKSIFAFVTWSAILSLFTIGAAMVWSGRVETWLAYAIVFGGPLISITLGGVVALMIQNNDLLRQIAQERSAGDVPSTFAAERREPTLRAMK